MSELLSHEFVQNAILAGVLASVLCGVIGTFVVVKRLVFISGGLSHAAFGGLGICYFLGIEPLIGAAGVSLIVALLLGAADPARVRSHDAAIGVFWAVGMALGVVFIHQTPGYAPNLMTYLFGNILTVSRGDVTMTALFVIVVLGVLALFFKELVAVAFDESFARTQGVPTRVLLTLLMVLIALSVVFLIRLVGIILVIALLTIPPLIGLTLVRSIGAVMVLATGVGIAMCLGGLGVSYRYDLPSGPAIVLLGACVLLVLRGGKELLETRKRERV